MSGQATDLEVDPSDFNRQFAAHGEPFGAAENGLYFSSNAGQSWTQVAGPWDDLAAGRMELAMAPSDADVLYVSVQDFSGGDFGSLLGLWKTQNASRVSSAESMPTWENIRVDPIEDLQDYCHNTADSQCYYDHELSVDPKDPDTLYAGGVWIWKNDGKDWKSLLPDHVDVHSMAWAGKRLIVGNDGGVSSSKNGGRTWKDHNAGLTLTQFYHGAMHPDRLGFVLGGSQDNGTGLRIAGAKRASLAGKDEWQRIFPSDGADTEISKDNPEKHWALSAQSLELYRTKDGGTTVELVTDGIDTSDAPFIAVFDKCPSNDDVFIAGTTQIWRSDNFFGVGAPSWKAQGPKLAAGDSISAAAFAPSDRKCKTYTFGTALGEIYVTKNGGKQWKNADKRDDVPVRFVTDVAFDPDDKKTLYASLSGFDEFTGEPGHLFMTSSALTGKPRWKDVGPAVNIPHNAIAIQPGRSRAGRSAGGQNNVVWLGTDLGVWRQQGRNWIHQGPKQGLPNVAVFDLQATSDGVVAFTHGRGAFLLKGAAKNRSRDLTAATTAR